MIKEVYTKALLLIEYYAFELTGSERYTSNIQRMFEKVKSLKFRSLNELIGAVLYIGCIYQYHKISQNNICKLVNIHEYRLRIMIKDIFNIDIYMRMKDR